MALVVITIEDDAEGAAVTVFAEPRIPDEDRTPAQAMAVEMFNAVAPKDAVPA